MECRKSGWVKSKDFWHYTFSRNFQFKTLHNFSRQIEVIKCQFFGEDAGDFFMKVFRKEEIKDLNFISFFFSSSSRFAHPIRRRRRWLKTRLAPSMLLVSELKILSIVQMLRVPLLYTAIMEGEGTTTPSMWYSISMLETLLWNASLLSQFMLHGVLWRGALYHHLKQNLAQCLKFTQKV